MRSLGVRSLSVTCELCHHEALLSAEHWGDAVLVRAFRPCMAVVKALLFFSASRDRSSATI